MFLSNVTNYSGFSSTIDTPSKTISITATMTAFTASYVMNFEDSDPLDADPEDFDTPWQITMTITNNNGMRWRQLRANIQVEDGVGGWKASPSSDFIDFDEGNTSRVITSTNYSDVSANEKQEEDQLRFMRGDVLVNEVETQAFPVQNELQGNSDTVRMLHQSLDPICYYSDGTTTYNFEDISGSGTRILNGTNDSAVANIDLGFTLSFYGSTYTQIWLSSNGLSGFSTAQTSGTNINLPTSTLNNVPLIAPLWDDWTFVPASADAVYYQTLGTTPTQRFIAQWNNACPDASCTGGTVTFEMKLFEYDNHIEFHYSDLTTSAARSNGGSATMGIRDTGGATNCTTIPVPEGCEFSCYTDGIPSGCDRFYQKIFGFAILSSSTAHSLQIENCPEEGEGWGWTHRP